MFRSFFVWFGAVGLVLILLASVCGGAGTDATSRGVTVEAWLSQTAPAQGHEHVQHVAAASIHTVNSLFPRITRASYPARDPGKTSGQKTGETASPGKSAELLVGGLDLWTSFPDLTPPFVAGDWLYHAFPLLSGRPIHIDAHAADENLAGKPSLLDKERLPFLMERADAMKSVGRFPTGPEGGYANLRIEVSHSAHHLKLLGNSYFGTHDVLYECRVGLGAPEFPTPVGLYFVTHIYDDDPWWIPPKNRAWAMGQSPSRRVYGGTMAPLLKKRFDRSSRRRSKSVSEDFVAGRVRLDDYGYRFHGTNSPRSIGYNQSHGCVRMYPKDARHLANLIKGYVGTVARKEDQNGSFVVLRAPVRLNLVK